MSSSLETLATKNESSEHQAREDNEYALLVMPSNTSTVDVHAQQPLQRSKYKSFAWWVKVLVGSLLLIVLSLIFLKWAVPFAFEKVGALKVDYVQLDHFLQVDRLCI